MGPHGLHHPAVVVDVPVFECECCEHSDVASSNEYSHVPSSSCREGGQVHFHVSVRGLVPWFVYALEIKWTLRSHKLAHTWKSVVKTTDTDTYTLREPLLQRGDDFHFGIMAWAAYKKGNDPFVIEATVRDMHPGLTSEEALIGTRNIDSSVSAVRLTCEEKKLGESTERTYYKLHSVDRKDILQIAFIPKLQDQEGGGRGVYGRPGGAGDHAYLQRGMDIRSVAYCSTTQSLHALGDCTPSAFQFLMRILRRRKTNAV